jgi:hypothetical protein
VFFDATNASGLANPAGNVFAIHQADDGTVYAGDGDSDSVYALRDMNGDGDANDAGEARLWFSSANAGGLPFVTPNGVAEGADGALYLVNAGVIAGPVDDLVYRTVDLNADGDANDAGEATVWLDLQTLNAKSSAFDINFIGDVAYVSDTNGADPDTIYRIEDLDGDGVIEAGEAKVFISDNNPFGVRLDLTHAVQGDSVLTLELTPGAGGVAHVYRLTELNGSGDIDQAAEAVEVWNTGLVPAGFENSVGFSIAAAENGDVAVTSNGDAANQRNVIRLSDLNGDGDYLDVGETILAASNALDAAFGLRPRALAFYQDGVPDAHPLPRRAPPPIHSARTSPSIISTTTRPSRSSSKAGTTSGSIRSFLPHAVGEARWGPWDSGRHPVCGEAPTSILPYFRGGGSVSHAIRARVRTPTEYPGRSAEPVRRRSSAKACRRRCWW